MHLPYRHTTHRTLFIIHVQHMYGHNGLTAILVIARAEEIDNPLVVHTKVAHLVSLETFLPQLLHLFVEQ